jgi:haloalkane dehalogenase
VHYKRHVPVVLETLNTCDIAAVKAKPAMLVSGDMDFAIAREHAISDFRGLFPDAPVVKVAGVGHFCQEDIPDTLVALIRGFMQANP